jgi:hypothetical protein
MTTQNALTSLEPVKLTDDPLSNVAHAEQFLRFVHPHHVFEIRGLTGKSVASGLFTDPHLAAIYAHKMSTTLHANVYHTLNGLKSPKHPATWPHPLNTARPRSFETTKGSDIEMRSNLFIDCDPVRPASEAATRAQTWEAYFFALNVRDCLSACGFPLPVVAFSGNGWYLVYRTPNRATSVPNANRSLVFFLHHLADKFDDGKTKIDRNVFDANRISRLPGFKNLKGGRIAQVFEYPPQYLPADYSALARAWGYVAPPPPSKSALKQLGTEGKIEQLIALYPEIFSLVRVTNDGDKTWYSFDPCPASGESHNKMNVGRGKSCLILHADGGVQFKCFHDECGEVTFAKLLKHCEDLTGRRCGIRFWPETEVSPEELQHAIEGWGGADLVE